MGERGEANAFAHGEADLVGFDLTGFSRAVDIAIREDGDRAVERIADALFAGETGAAETLAPLGFEFAETTGDGAVFVRRARREEDPRARAEEDLVIADAAAAWSRATGLGVRHARTRGEVGTISLDGYPIAQTRLWFGAAIMALHDALAATSRRPASGPPFARAKLHEARMPLAAKAAAGGVEAIVVTACRLLDRAEATHASHDALSSRIGVYFAAARGLTSAVTRISLDEKGLIARAERIGADARARQDALAETRALAAGLPGGPAFGLAAGRVYRGPMGRGGANTHGVCVNLAAKRAAAAHAGATTADPSFASARSEARGRDERRHGPERRELDLMARALAEGRSPLVIEGPAGIGKSDTLRRFEERELASGRETIAVACRPDHRLAPLSVLHALARRRLDLSPDRRAPALDASSGDADALAEAVVDACLRQNLDLARAIEAAARGARVGVLRGALPFPP